MNLSSLCGVNQDFVCQRSAYFRVPGVFLAGVRLRASGGGGREIQAGCEKSKAK